MNHTRLSLDDSPPPRTRVRPAVAISMGDANGIGPEVSLKCAADIRLRRILVPILVGSTSVLREHADRLGFQHIQFKPFADGDGDIESDVVPVIDVSKETNFTVSLGSINGDAGRLAMWAVDEAIDLCLQGTVDAMVTAPISKEAIRMGGFDTPGHTEFIAKKCGSTSYMMMMVADRLKVALVTGHIPIWDVPRKVTPKSILNRLSVLDKSLRQDFSIAHPRLAVLSLNPHAGEGGLMGKEEQVSIVPAIEEAKQKGINAVGPFPSDGFFGASTYLKFDGVLAMYHDQGLVPFKTLAFDSGVNFTAGLPIVRTSPDHGTAFDIAGQGVASPESMRSAIYLAVDISRRRVKQVG